MPKACSYWHDHVRIVAHGSREDTGVVQTGLIAIPLRIAATVCQPIQAFC